MGFRVGWPRVGVPKAPPPKSRMESHPPPLRLLGVAVSIFQRPLQDLCGGRGNGEMSPGEGEGVNPPDTILPPHSASPLVCVCVPLKTVGKVGLSPQGPRDEWGN